MQKCAVCENEITGVVDMQYLVPMHGYCRQEVDLSYEEVRLPDGVAFGRSDVIAELDYAIGVTRERLAQAKDRTYQLAGN